MDNATKDSIITSRELRLNGKIYNWRRVYKGHKCSGCGLPIEPRTNCFTEILAGSGLGSTKFPDYYHYQCL